MKKFFLHRQKQGNLPSDKELFARITQGDKEAFRWLYDRYNRLLDSWAKNRTPYPELVEEITQEFWIKIWQDPGMIIPD